MKSYCSLADAFYEAALVPELWPQACEALAAEVNATTAAVITIDPSGAHRFVCSPNIREAIEFFSHHPVRLQNVRPIRALQRMPSIFGRDLDLLTEEEMQNDPVLHEINNRFGNHWTVGAVLQEPSGHTIVFDMQRKKGMDHYSDAELAHLNAIRPDLFRSIFLASRLAFSEAKSVASTLSMLGLPAIVLGESMKVMAVNPEAEQLAPRIRTGAFDRLFLDSKSASALLSDAFTRLQPEIETGVQSIPLSSSKEGAPLIMHLLPIRRSGHDIFCRSLAILVVTAVGTLGAPDMRVLSGLFDLTPKEVQVARKIALSQSVEDIAISLHVSIETVRTHVKHIMLKTGTSRQPELMYLLLGLSPPIRPSGGRTHK